MMHSGRVASRQRRGERGATALEFGLLVPVLFAMLFGIIDYGLWFSDSLAVRQGVREGARFAVVKNVTAVPAGCSPAPTTDYEKLACKTKQNMGALGPAYVRFVLPAGTWEKRRPLLVCGMVKSPSLGLVPLPAGGWVKSKTRMSIEVDGPPSGSLPSDAPSGGDWSWCS